MKKLLYEIKKALDSGWNPLENVDGPKEQKIISSKECIETAYLNKTSSSLSNIYKRDLRLIKEHLLQFLEPAELAAPISRIPLHRFETFLRTFDSSGTNYMTKRRTLSALLSETMRKGHLKANPISSTLKRKSKSTLHIIYTHEEMLAVLNFLELRFPHLHLCCLLAYGCLLRPHHEARLLTLGHFKKDFSEIHLSGGENKSGNIRIVYIPVYVQRIVKIALKDVSDSRTNIFSQCELPFKEGYFNTQWGRAKKRLQMMNLLRNKQTIYSFRHTAAVNVYNKTKDIYIVQQLLGHSDLQVTLKYLRGLGIHLNEKLQHSLPEL